MITADGLIFIKSTPYIKIIFLLYCFVDIIILYFFKNVNTDSLFFIIYEIAFYAMKYISKLLPYSYARRRGFYQKPFYNTDTGLFTLITYAVAINITANVKATIICPASVSVSNLYHSAFRNFISGILAATTNVTLIWSL